MKKIPFILLALLCSVTLAQEIDTVQRADVAPKANIIEKAAEAGTIDTVQQADIVQEADIVEEAVEAGTVNTVQLADIVQEADIVEEAVEAGTVDTVQQADIVQEADIVEKAAEAGTVDTVQQADVVQQPDVPQESGPAEETAEADLPAAPPAAPSIAVYVTGGDISGNTKDALAALMLDGLVNSGLYRAIERSETFLAAVDQEHVAQRSGAIDDAQIRELGKQAGVQFVCVAAITPAMGQHQISARIIDIETAAIAASGVSSGTLGALDDLKRVSAAVIYNMIGVRVKIDKDFQLLTEREETVLEQKVERSVEEGIKRSKRRKPSFWVGFGVDIAGVAMFGYGLYEDGNVANHDKKAEFTKAEAAAKRRNAAYIAGAVILLSGVSIQIMF